MGISPRRLHQLFAATDSTVGQYIHRMRIRRACALLDAPHTRQWTVAKIAHHCGFCSRSHFSKAFTAALGHSPSDHRSDPQHAAGLR
ncbi:helix-turn-helix transcriptional regulator [Rhodococcus enclensis]|nr:helix-turn-helix transcriptional regulator [Rhodococcus qingshengii]